jgi:hypothetical protein
MTINDCLTLAVGKEDRSFDIVTRYGWGFSSSLSAGAMAENMNLRTARVAETAASAEMTKTAEIVRKSMTDE